MPVILTIETDNAAFGDRPHEEAARILRELADKVEAGRTGSIKPVDRNGNASGVCWVEYDDPDGE